MFLDELSPLMRELIGHPAAFLGGFASGLFHLNLSEDPVKSWLEQQGAAPATTPTPSVESEGPQSISID